MNYDVDLEYDDTTYSYSGAYVVSPESFGINTNLGNQKVLAVVVLSPPSIDSTLVFVNTHSLIVSTTVIENTETLSNISFSSYSSGVIAFSIRKDEAYAISSAESIILENNSAGTIDVTIMSNN